MFNVLPEKFKQSIKSQYKKRLVLLWLLLVISLELILVVSLVPSLMFLNSEESSLALENYSPLTSGSDNTPQSTDVFKTVNGELGVLSSTVPPYSFGDVISEVVSLKSAAITIKEVSYKNQTATSSLISLTGVAADRESLLAFEKKITADALFQNVNLPVSDFAKDKNIDFSLSMTTDK